MLDSAIYKNRLQSLRNKLQQVHILILVNN